MRHRHMLSLLALSALLLSAVPVRAQTYGFDHLTTNSFANYSTAGQYRFVVSDAGNSVVSFRFENLGPSASSIADIYFDDRSLFQSLTVGGQSSGVSFSAGASPPNLPSGANASPDFVATFTADSNAPVQHNGVNPNEWVRLDLLLATGKTYASALADLGSGDLRVGIHVQGFSNGGSESFINTPVPEPETYAMALVALGVLAMYRRKQARSDQSTV